MVESSNRKHWKKYWSAIEKKERNIGNKICLNPFRFPIFPWSLEESNFEINSTSNLILYEPAIRNNQIHERNAFSVHQWISFKCYPSHSSRVFSRSGQSFQPLDKFLKHVSPPNPQIKSIAIHSNPAQHRLKSSSFNHYLNPFTD